MSEWYVPFTHVQFDMTKLMNRQNRNMDQNVKSVYRSIPLHSTRVLYRANIRSVIDPSRHLDGTLEMDLDSRRRKSVRLVQRLKGFVRLVYLICACSSVISTYLPIPEGPYMDELMNREFGLPVQVRDAALGRKNTAPTSDINKRELPPCHPSTMNKQANIQNTIYRI